MFAIVGASGKIGGATLNAILEHELLPPDQIVATTSSHQGDQKWNDLASKGIQVRHASFDDATTFDKALVGCEKLFLVSTPQISLDFFDAPHGQGREKHHFVAIDAARRAGVKHIYYTSLAFNNPSKASVMRTHVRTEAYLKELSDIKYTIIREGLYNESWPLYFGHYELEGDDRTEITVAGDGPISWTAIPDLGLASALVFADSSDKYAGQTFYLSDQSNTITLEKLAQIVSEAKGINFTIKQVTRSEHEEFYVKEKSMDEGYVTWWASTYDALKDGECDIADDTFTRLLQQKNVRPTTIEETVKEMLQSK
jgi:uncharacterized protein YbjT (DUF2867 family)